MATVLKAWADLAGALDCTPPRLTNLRAARLADMGLVMRITQWLLRPAAAFIHPAQWCRGIQDLTRPEAAV